MCVARRIFRSSAGPPSAYRYGLRAKRAVELFTLRIEHNHRAKRRRSFNLLVVLDRFLTSSGSHLHTFRLWNVCTVTASSLFAVPICTVFRLWNVCTLTASSLLAVPTETIVWLWNVCEVAAGVPGAIRSAAGVQGAGRLPSVAGHHPVRKASATVLLVCSSVTQASES